jgi:hypothetical protein
MFEEDINNVVKGKLEKQLVKKTPNLSNNVIFPTFFLQKIISRKRMCSKAICGRRGFVDC